MKKRTLATVLTMSMAVSTIMTGGISVLADDAPVTLNFYYWDEGQKEGMDAIISLFEEQNSNIKIESTIIPWGEYWTKLQTSLPNGSGPDIFWMNLYAEPYINEGLLYDLSDAVEADGVDLSVFPQSVLETYKVDEHIYGIPKDYDGIAIYYNKEIFDEMGIDYPEAGWTWDDLLQKAQALTNDVHYGYASRSGGEIGYRSYILSNGGTFTNEDHTKATYSSPESVEALQFLHDMMYVQKCSPTAAEMVEMDPTDMFVSGLVAMDPNGSWALSRYYEALGDKLGIIEMPKKVTNTTPTSGLAFAVAAKGSHTEEAVKFVEFAATKEAQEASVSAAIPANSEAADAWLEYYSECPDAHFLVDSVNDSVSNPTYANGHTQEGEQILDDAVNTAWMDENADIQAIMTQADEDLNELISK